MESFYKNWLEKNKTENLQTNLIPLATEASDQRTVITPTSNTSLEENEQQTVSVREPDQSSIDFSSALSNIIFEDGNLQLTIEKGNHIKQRKFRLEDHLFYVKIKLKNPHSDVPLLRDILNFLEVGFDYIINEVRKFYKNEEHNIAFLTLYQQPMISGLNTGGFDIQESGTEIVQRILKMLEQFLVSNQTLKLDDTFKVYLKVLSITHMNYQKNAKKRVHKKRTKEFYKRKKTYGGKQKPIKRFNYYWALDVPENYPKAPHLNILKDKCLLTSTILGLLQNDYFSSNRKDRRFLYAQNINSINIRKQNHAGKIILLELNKMCTNLQLPLSGPYDLEETTKKLSQELKCQFFIFDGMCNSKKLIYMYPQEYQDDLKPIYLFQPQEAKNHLVFIRNYHSYCRANMKICFGCKKTFLTHNYKHLCPKRKSCFSCRRFFQTSNTYLHEKLQNEFCDKDVTLEKEFICSLCNVTCYSQHCFKGHKLRCSGEGTFGYKCLKCNKFTYRYGKMNTKNLKEKHCCSDFKPCKFCRQPKELYHQCKIKTETISNNFPKLAFIGMELFDKSSENCIRCDELRSQDNHLFCESHTNHQLDTEEPILTIIYAEEKIRGLFTKYELNNFENRPVLYKSDNVFSYNYTLNSMSNEHSSKENSSRKKKVTQDFKTNFKTMQTENPTTLMDLLLQLITAESWRNTTFICQDENSLIYVSE